MTVSEYYLELRSDEYTLNWDVNRVGHCWVVHGDYSLSQEVSDV